MTPQAQLLFAGKDQGLKAQGLAEWLEVSAPYASLMLAGKRPIPARVAAQVADYCRTSDSYQAFAAALGRAEQALRRPLTTQEQVALAQGWPNLEAILALIGQGAVAEAGAQGAVSRQDQFQVSTALASLQSLSQILDEEPDLPEAQRQHFISSIKQQAQNLTQLLALETSEKAPDQEPVRIQPDRFVDQVFSAQGYYFDALEVEADLAVRRTRRHGPLGTFALVSRLEQDHGMIINWLEGGGMQPSSLLQAPPDKAADALALDPSLGEAQLRFRLAQFLIAREADGVFEQLVAAAQPPNDLCHGQLKKALIAYAAAAMFMPYDAFLDAAETHRYDLDWLSRHFACTYEQVCHRVLALRKPGESGVPFGLLRVSPAGQTVTRVSLPGLPMPDRFAACPLWAAYAAFRQTGETLTQLAEFPDGERFVFIGRMNEGPRAHFGSSRRLTSLMLACNWAYADRLIYADGHDPQRPASMTPVGHACITCPRPDCRSRIRPFQGN